MRRILATLLALLTLAMPAALAENVPAVDLDSMTVEELTALHSEVTSRIAMIGSGDVVSDEDGIKVVWNNLVDTKYSYFKFGFTIFNQTGQDCRFDVTAGGVNGIQMGPTSNTGAMELKDGMGVFTGGYSRWMVENMLEELGMTHASEIYLQITLYETDPNAWDGEPLRTIDLRFPVDIPLA